MEYFYFASKIILLVYFLFIAFRPDKLGIRKFNTTQVRIIAIIIVLMNAFFIGYKIYSQRTEMPMATADSEKNPLYGKLKAKLVAYSEDTKSNPWSKACIQENIKTMKTLKVQTSDDLIELVALHSCACSYQNLKGLPALEKSEQMIQSGTDYVTALNDSFTDMAEFEKRVLPCTEIN